MSKERLTQEEINRRASVSAAIQVKQAFELYAYRLISETEFVSQMTTYAAVLLDSASVVENVD